MDGCWTRGTPDGSNRHLGARRRGNRAGRWRVAAHVVRVRLRLRRGQRRLRVRRHEHLPALAADPPAGVLRLPAERRAAPRTQETIPRLAAHLAGPRVTKEPATPG